MTLLRSFHNSNAFFDHNQGNALRVKQTLPAYRPHQPREFKILAIIGRRN